MIFQLTYIFSSIFLIVYSIALGKDDLPHSKARENSTIDVKTEYGIVRGHEVPIIHQDGSTKIIHSFLGLPFAKPPINQLRFERPEKPNSWVKPFEAGSLGNVCMQDIVGILAITHPGYLWISEDCLNMNIYAPKVLNGKKLPVMFYLHGGAYVGGGNIQYPGHFLAAKDVVVVIPNYRLGVFGYMNTPKNTVKGNMGLWDQLFALEFVKRNIENFGGDPNQITVFGESAGASSTALLTISPKAKGLFKQAIQQSGTEHNLWSINYPESNPASYSLQVAENANCPTDVEADMVSCLKKLSSRELRRADNFKCTAGHFCQGFSPVVDGPDGMIPDYPLKLRKSLGKNSIKLLTGITKDEGSMFNFMMVPESKTGGYNSTRFISILQETFIDIFKARLTEEQYNNLNSSIVFYYTPYPFIENKEANRDAMNKIISDATFGFPWDQQAKINALHIDTYAYVFEFTSSNSKDTFPEWLGAPHMADLPYVFGFGYLTLNPYVRKDSHIRFDIIKWNHDDILYGEYIMSLWTNFAKYGNPTHKPVKRPFNDDFITWPNYNAATNFSLLYFSKDVHTEQLYKQRDYMFYIDYLLGYVAKDIKPNAGSQLSSKTGLDSHLFLNACKDYLEYIINKINFDSS